MNKDVVYRQNITLITSSSDNKLKQFFVWIFCEVNCAVV